jgi:hypothetical protein
MSIEAARGHLRRAMCLRVPSFRDEPHTGAQKRDELETYMLDSAIARGDLEECVVWMRELQGRLGDEWEGLTGYEVHLPTRKQPSAADIQRAKRQASPGIYMAARDVRQLIDHCLRQIARFEHEERVVISRVYSMISGA